MPTKREANKKVSDASRACDKVQASTRAAYNALNASASVNGYGIYHDYFSVRDNLLKAQENIQAALKVLNDVDWPSNAEYDLL